MDPEYIKALTPGGKFVRARVLDREWPVKQSNFGHVNHVPLFDETGKTVVAKFITERIDHKKDCPVLVTGDRGAGKSTVIGSIALEIDPKFPVDNVAFRLTDFAAVFDKNPQGDGENGIYPQISMDEAGHALYGSEWLKQEQRIIAKQLIISRIKQQIIWMAVPKRKQFNNQVRDMAYIWIHVLEPREYLQGYAIVRVAPPDMQSEWLPEKYWAPRFVFTFPSLTGEWWDAYEKKKITFVNEVTAETAKGKGRTKENDSRDAAIRRLVEDHTKLHDPISARELSTDPSIGLSHAQISRILNA